MLTFFKEHNLIFWWARSKSLSGRLWMPGRRFSRRNRTAVLLIL